MDRNDNTYQTQIKLNQNQIQEKEEELKEDSIQQVFVPSFDTKLIKSIDTNLMLSPKNQEQSQLINSPKSQNPRFTLYLKAEQKLQVTAKKTIKSIFNQQIGLNSGQKMKQRKIKLEDSRLLKQNSFGEQSQIKNTFENNTYRKMSYFEEQYSIQNDSDLQEKYISSFFKRMADDEEISEIDLRILDSLI
ncbi:hypothetical protein ABPG74_003897 [Tetrahymena malaccensis]